MCSGVEWCVTVVVVVVERALVLYVAVVVAAVWVANTRLARP
jgi:hypothetical protein